MGVLSELATFHPLATFRCELGEHADTKEPHDLFGRVARQQNRKAAVDEFDEFAAARWLLQLL